MNVELESILEKTPMIKSFEVLEKQSGDEVLKEKLHIVVTDAETGKKEFEFDSSCTFICAKEIDKENEVNTLLFNSCSTRDVVLLAKSIKKGLETLEKSNPFIKLHMDLENILLEKRKEDNDD